jgi:hypothetical protein
MGYDNDDIDGNPGDFLGTNDDDEFEFGNDAHGFSPLAAAPPTAPTVDPSSSILGTPTSPPKQRSALRSTSFAPVAANPLPTMNDAIDADPDFFEGVAKDGKGPGPHFITMSFVKEKNQDPGSAFESPCLHRLYPLRKYSRRFESLHSKEQ